MQTQRLSIVLLILAFASHACAGESPSPETVKADLKALQGTWKLVSAQRKGLDVTEDVRKTTAAITFEGDAWLSSTYGRDFYSKKNSRIILDPTKTPRTFDHVVTRRAPDGTTVTLTYPGIYELDGDKLKLCYDTGLKVRPTEFNSKGKDTHIFIVLKRSSPEKK